MSYVDQGMTPGRVWAIVMVAILHALIGYAFVTGLAYKFVKNVQEDLKTFDVQEAPPPEEEPPPPPDTPQPPPPVTTPPPMQRFENLPPPPVAAPPPPPVPAPYVPPAPAAAAGSAAAASHRRAGPRPREPGILRLERRLSRVGPPQRGTGHDRLPPDRWPGWPRQQLCGHLVERLVRARCGHVPSDAQPRPVHARA